MTISRGISRIVRASNLQVRTFGEGRRVPSYYSYYEEYLPINLPLLTSYRNINTTHVLSKVKKLNLNYMIRGCVIELIEQANKSRELDTYFITINFSCSFTARLERMKSPVSYYGKKLKTYFKPFDVMDFFCVIEQGDKQKEDKRRLHAHLVITCRKQDIQKITNALQSPNEIQVNSSGHIEPTAVHSKNYFNEFVYKKHISNDEFELITMEIEEYNDQTAWEKPNSFHENNGVAFIKKNIGVNVALADYLSKQLNTQLLAGSKRNYYISNSLVLKVKERAMAIIGQNKLAMNYN